MFVSPTLQASSVVETTRRRGGHAAGVLMAWARQRKIVVVAGYVIHVPSIVISLVSVWLFNTAVLSYLSANMCAACLNVGARLYKTVQVCTGL